MLIIKSSVQKSYLLLLGLLLLGCQQVKPVRAVSDANFDEVLAREKNFVVALWAEACGSCQKMEPVIERFAAEHHLPVYRMDVLANPEIPARYQMVVTPTMLLFRDGELQKTKHGSQTLSELRAWSKP